MVTKTQGKMASRQGGDNNKKKDINAVPELPAEIKIQGKRMQRSNVAQKIYKPSRKTGKDGKPLEIVAHPNLEQQDWLFGTLAMVTKTQQTKLHYWIALIVILSFAFIGFASNWQEFYCKLLGWALLWWGLMWAW